MLGTLKLVHSLNALSPETPQAPKGARDIFSRPPLSTPQVELTLGGYKINALVQGLTLRLNGKDLVPQVELIIVPGGLDVLLEKGLVTLKELAEADAQTFDLDGGTHYSLPLPFPITRGELLDAMNRFVLSSPDRKEPTRLHMPPAMWEVVKHRWGLSPDDPRPVRVLGVEIVYGADRFWLE